jgi:hypothetical protein
MLQILEEARGPTNSSLLSVPIQVTIPVMLLRVIAVSLHLISFPFLILLVDLAVLVVLWLQTGRVVSLTLSKETRLKI